MVSFLLLRTRLKRGLSPQVALQTLTPTLHPPMSSMIFALTKFALLDFHYDLCAFYRSNDVLMVHFYWIITFGYTSF